MAIVEQHTKIRPTMKPTAIDTIRMIVALAVPAYPFSGSPLVRATHAMIAIIKIKIFKI